ncbi:DUF5690 family protein [Parapedobacter pyrenivorans]|uniref:DUF5690 family protein n=1 Tax=Parapedobacter pyrenivorans TaxID=1305674 RepID=UPI00333F7E3E
MESRISTILARYPKTLFIAWSVLASFGAYFCMYAFRKPFNTGLYEGLTLWGLDYKTILIVMQVLGYMLSKFIGIKVIAELKAKNRISLIIALILFAELSLLGFGSVPHPYNWIFLFLNGLPLGMVWGVVFSFLEGRRFTEVLVFGLSISVIVSSGILKSIYLVINNWMPGVNEFWMPFVMGAYFLPLFVLFVWMLSVIPAPTAADKRQRMERIPMDNVQKKAALSFFGTGLLCVIIIYALLTTLRDFRDNFSVEIWNTIDPHWQSGFLSFTELVAGVVVLVLIALLSLIKDNHLGFWATVSLIAMGLLGCSLTTLLYQQHVLSAFSWTLLLGVSLFMAYTPIQTVFFDRLLAVSRFRGNAGFFIYICDTAGYLGSVTLLLYKEFFIAVPDPAQILINFSYGTSVVGFTVLLGAAWFFRRLNPVRKSTVQPTHHFN